MDENQTEAEAPTQQPPPALDVPHVVARTLPGQSGRRRESVHAGGEKWGLEWRAVPLQRFTEEQQAHLRKEAARGMLELRFRDPTLDEAVDEKAKRVGGAIAKAYRAAVKTAAAADEQLEAKVGEIDAAAEELTTARATLGSLEVDFAQGSAEWSAVEAADAAVKRAAARLRGLERGIGVAERERDEARRALREAELAVCVEAVDGAKLGERLDEALAPAIEAWPKVVRALEEVAECWRRYRADLFAANALSQELTGELALEVPSFPAGRVVQRFSELAEAEEVAIPMAVVEAAFARAIPELADAGVYVSSRGPRTSARVGAIFEQAQRGSHG